MTIRPRLGPEWFLGILLGLLLLGAGFSLRDSVQLLQHAGDNTYPEAAEIQIALWTNNTGHIYTSPEDPPYTPAVYGPLFYLSLATLARLGHGSSFENLLLVGRLLVFLCYLLIPLVVYKWGRRAGFHPLLAGLSSVLTLSDPYFIPWMVAVRPDLPAIFLSLLAFYLVSREDSPGLVPTTTSGILVGLALLLKQSLLAAPTAILVWLLSQRRIRHALGFVVATALPVGLILGALWLRGDPVLRLMFLIRHSALDPSSELSIIFEAFDNYPAEALELGLALLGLLTIRGDPQPRKRLLALYFVLSWGLGLATFMQVGGYLNYLYEGWVLCALLLPFAVRRIMEAWAGTPEILRGVSLLMLVVILSLSLGDWGGNDRPADYKQFASAFRNEKVLSDIPYVAVHGREPELLDPWVCNTLEIAGRWSPEPILKQLDGKKFDYVVLELGKDGNLVRYRGYERMSISILGAVGKNYEPFCVYGSYSSDDSSPIRAPRPRAVVLKPRNTRPVDSQTEAALVRAGCTVSAAPFMILHR